MNENAYIIDEQSDTTDPIMKAINKYKHLPNIFLINRKLSSPESFSFTKICNSDIEREIKPLNIRKVTKFKNIPPKVLKSTTHSCSETLAKLFNDTMNNSKLSDEIKLAKVMVTFKKDNSTKSKSYRPVIVLTTVSKVFETIMNSQMSMLLNNVYPLKCVGTEKFLVQNKPYCL